MEKQIKIRVGEEQYAALEKAAGADTSVPAFVKTAALSAAQNRFSDASGTNRGTTDPETWCHECGGLAPHVAKQHLCRPCWTTQLADQSESEDARATCVDCRVVFKPLARSDDRCAVHVHSAGKGHCKLCRRDNMPLRWDDLPVCSLCLYDWAGRQALITALHKGRMQRRRTPENRARREQ